MLKIKLAAQATVSITLHLKSACRTLRGWTMAIHLSKLMTTTINDEENRFACSRKVIILQAWFPAKKALVCIHMTLAGMLKNVIRRSDIMRWKTTRLIREKCFLSLHKTNPRKLLRMIEMKKTAVSTIHRTVCPMSWARRLSAADSVEGSTIYGEDVAFCNSILE